MNEEVDKPTKMERKHARREEKRLAREKEQQRQQAARKSKWAVLAVGVVVLVGGIYLASDSDENGGESHVASGTVTLTDSEWSKGSADAKAVLVEYGDFQCPACGAYHPIVQSISEELGDDLRVVFRHFPLRQPHPNAQMAGQAAEAAGRQGKFWEMHDVLFERQGQWSSGRGAREKFIEYAVELELDKTRFESDIDDQSVEDAVNEDYDSGLRAGVDSTPTFYLNGEKMEGLATFDDFTGRIREVAQSSP